MADWYVYQPDGPPLGPFSTELIAGGIASGRISRQVWIGAPGGPRWLRAIDIPVIAALLSGAAPPSNLRVIGGSEAQDFKGTVMIVNDDEISLAFGEPTMMVSDDEVEISEPASPPPGIIPEGVPTQRGLPDD